MTALAVDTDGTVYIGGRFDSVTQSDGSVLEVNGVARWNGVEWRGLGDWDGAGIYRFTGHDCSDANHVAALRIHNGFVYVGGQFQHIVDRNDGEFPDTRNIARWRIESGAWEPLGSIGSNACDLVLALDVYNDQVIVGGDFERVSVGGEPVNTDRMVRWDEAEAAWEPISGIYFGGISRNGVTGTIGRVLAFAEGEHGLYVGGTFIRTGSESNANIVLWDNGSWKGLEEGVTGATQTDYGFVRALVEHDGQLLVAGDFQRTGDQTRRYFAIWSDPATE